MADDPESKTVKYRRRLDRTPEKQFEKLPEAEKKLISAMRGALENCRNKVDWMKNDLAEKEKAIEVERSRRKEAEERLKQYLVDPYQSPNVNSELRHRLPRANKSDPLLDNRDFESTEESGVEEETVLKSRSSRSHAKSASSPRGGSQNKKKVRRSLSFQTPAESHSKRVSQDCPDGDGEMEDTSSDEEENRRQSEPRSSRSRRKGRHSSDHSAAPPLFSPLHYPQYAPGGAGYPGGPYVSPFYRPLALTPWSSMSSISMYSTPFSPREGQLPPPQSRIPLSRSFPLLSGEKVGGLGSSASADPHQVVAEQMQASADAGLHSAPKSQPDSEPPENAKAEEGANQTATATPQNSSNQKSAIPSELFSHSASSLSSHYGLPTSLTAGTRDREGRGLGPSFPLAGLPSYSASPLATGMSDADLSLRHAAMLQEEIVHLREANRQLMERLSSRVQEVETLKMQILAETPNNATLDTDAAKKFAELMAEVKAAEKRREDTMEARVCQMERDREQFMHDVENAAVKTRDEKRPGRHLTLNDLSSESETESEDEEKTRRHHGMDREENSSPSGKLNPDAGRVASLKDALKELERRHGKELQIYQEELQVVLEQRDQALEQLQAEREKYQIQQLRMPAQREQILMAKISALQRELDRVENTARQLKEEQMERNLFISLHKALFPDSALNDNDKTANTADSKLTTKLVDNDDDRVQVKMKEDNQLLEQLRQANVEKSLLQRRCEELEAACKQEKDEKNRLERLNGVLRKKLISMSAPTHHLQEE